MRRGLSALSSDQPAPNRSITPGAKFSSRTSAPRARRFSTATPFGDLRSRVMQRLCPLSMAKGAPAPRLTSLRWRTGSPVSGSILITSAPAFAMSQAA